MVVWNGDRELERRGVEEDGRDPATSDGCMTYREQTNTSPTSQLREVVTYLVEASEQEVAGETGHSRGVHSRVARLRGPRLHPMNTSTGEAAPTAIEDGVNCNVCLCHVTYP